MICSDFEHEKRGNSIGNTNSTLHYNISFNDHTRTFLINGPLRNIEVKGNIIYNVVDENLVGVVDATPNAAVNKNVIFSQNRFYTKAPFKAYRGYWKANGCGTFAQKAPMNYKQIQFSKVFRHKEPGMKMLKGEHTLFSLCCYLPLSFLIIERIGPTPLGYQGGIPVDTLLLCHGFIRYGRTGVRRSPVPSSPLEYPYT